MSTNVMTGHPAADARTQPVTDAELVERARGVVRAEASALEALAPRVGDEFLRAVHAIGSAPGRVIVSGIGKSGIIGRKIAATLTSTGTPASFLHPVESFHGDLGIIGAGDVAILISKSGESGELAALAEYLCRVGVTIIALTGGLNSTLARAATVTLDCSVELEACPFDLAPTTSTTVTLALGDALAVALLLRKGFTREDFARLHPGGALGRRLTIRVRDVMIDDGYPVLPENARMKECLVLLAEQRGTVPIVDAEQRVVGVVTTGDFTRLLERVESFLEVPVTDAMTRDPKVADAGMLGSAAVHLMEKHGIMALPVVDAERHIQGIVHLHDLMRAGAV